MNLPIPKYYHLAREIQSAGKVQAGMNEIADTITSTAYFTQKQH